MRPPGSASATGDAPTELRARRALALARLGDPDAAWRELDALSPGQVDALPGLAPALIDCALRAERPVAAPAYRRAVAILDRAAVGRRGDDTLCAPLALALNNLADLLLQEGRHAEAAPLAEWAVSLADAHLAPDDVHRACYLDTLAEVRTAEGRAAEAGPLYERAVALSAGLPAENPTRSEILSHQAAHLRRTGQARSGAEPAHPLR